MKSDAIGMGVNMLSNKKKSNFDVPVLFLVFNRPETTRRVFNQIKKIKPAKLYVVADGPRGGVSGEVDKCAQVRAIATNVDWDCKVETHFRNENLGCKLSISNGIDWFFSKEDRGIILEDDCLPNDAFFAFCKKMLELYENAPKVFSISGINIFGQDVQSNSYYFSKYQSIWGWATWRSRWIEYDVEIKDRVGFSSLDSENEYPDHFVKHMDFCLDLIQSGLNDTWDYQLQYFLAKSGGYCVRPIANMISNIGPDGVHSHNNYKQIFHSYGNCDADRLIHPFEIKQNKYEDLKYWEYYRAKFKTERFRIFLFKIGLYKTVKNLSDSYRRCVRSLRQK
jgi:hypothetical protein